MLSSMPIFMLCVCLVFILFYFYTYMISWRGYIFIAVRLCVCVWERVCRSVCLSVNKFPAKLCTHLDVVLCQMVAYFTGCNPIKIGDFWLKVKGHIKWINDHISQTISFIDIIPGTKAQYNKRHLMTSAFLILTQGQGYTTRSKA